MLFVFAGMAGGLVASQSALAATYFVSTAGLDSADGSADAPFRTITFAYGKAAAGDTIIVKPGRYTDLSGPGWGIHLGKSGTAENPIMLRSETPGEAIIDGMQSSTRNRGLFIDGAYNILDGFRITNAYGEGIGIYGGKNNIIKNCEIDHNGLANPTESGHSGVYTSELSSGNSYIGNTSHENGNPNTNVKGHGFYAAGFDNETYVNNVAYGNYGFGIQIASYRTMSNMIVSNNTLVGNGKSGIVLYSPSASFVSAQINNNVIVKNMEYGVLIYQAMGGGVALDSNLAFGNSLGRLYQTNSSLTYVSARWTEADPQFTAPSDFHLLGQSPAIDRAISSSAPSTDKDGNLRPSGSGPDIGAYEANSAAAAAPPPTDLIQNGGFESGLDKWLNRGNGSVTSSSVYGGAASLQVGKQQGGVDQSVPGLKPGISYELSFAARSGSRKDQGGVIGLAFYNSSDVRIANASATIKATNWTTYKIQATAPASFAYALVYVWKYSGTSYLYADDFKIK